VTASKSSKLGVLEAEVRKKRGIKPIRKLFGQLGEVVQALKPCFLMSPMSAAQYLEPGKLPFDVVIFDEASQVEPADALGAIARAKQVILVGDEKQLPPTNIYGKVNDAEADDDPGDDDSLNTKDLESVLAMGVVAGLARTSLRWHYRSKHASLIQFSNVEFYDRQLRVFPSPQRDRDELGLSFRPVADGARVTGQVKSRLQIALDTGNSVRRFEVRGKFVWPPGLTVPPVRWRGGDDDPKDAELICAEEVAQAAVLLLQREFGIPLDDLPAATLRAMGFKRIGPQLAELGSTAIQQAIAAQRIRPDASGFMVAAEAPSA
jgi:hypothetical protein